MSHRPQSGFNLLELMMVVFIAAIIFGIGVPYLGNFIDESEMAGASNDLIAGMHLARSEAVKRQRVVTLCSSAAPLADPPACDPGNLDGFVVFEDTDADGAIDAGEPVIQTQAGAPAAITISSDGSYISYAPSGFRTDTAAVPSATLVLLCDERGLRVVSGLTAARVLRIDPSGRAQILRSPAEVNPVPAMLGASCP